MHPWRKWRRRRGWRRRWRRRRGWRRQRRWWRRRRRRWRGWWRRWWRWRNALADGRLGLTVARAGLPRAGARQDVHAVLIGVIARGLVGAPCIVGAQGQLRGARVLAHPRERALGRPVVESDPRPVHPRSGDGAYHRCVRRGVGDVRQAATPGAAHVARSQPVDVCGVHIITVEWRVWRRQWRRRRCGRWWRCGRRWLGRRWRRRWRRRGW